MRVLLATPTLQQQPTVAYLMAVVKTQNLLAQHGIMMDTCFVGGDAFISKARNGLVQSFIETWKTEFSADMLLFIDDDQSWDEMAVLRWCMDPHEIIASAVPKKTDAAEGQPQTFNNVMLDTTPEGQCFVEHGLLRATQIGSGMLSIKRGAIEKLMKAYPARYAPGDGGIHALHYNFFEAKIIWDEKDPMITGQFWGEDLVFCKRWVALGEHIWIDANVSMEHIGRKSWSGNFLHFLQKHASVEVSGQTQQATEPLPETLNEIERLAA